MRSTAAAVPGVIERDAIYTLRELKRRAGMGDWALRQARRRGLNVIYVGGRGYVRGSDFQAYLDTFSTRERANG